MGIIVVENQKNKYILLKIMFARIFKRTLCNRLINLSAGAAPLPLPVLEKAQKNFLQFNSHNISVAELGYRTPLFKDLIYKAEESFRKLLKIPDNFEVHFFNGGATLQFAAIPMNLLGKPNNYATTHYKIANYVRNGHWSEKARDEARMYCHVNETWVDPKDLYFSLPPTKKWNIDPRGAYLHYTSADTRQGFEFKKFPYEIVPEGMTLCSDQSVNLGTKSVDFSKYGVIYAAGHKNFTTSGVCYSIIRKDLIDCNVLPGTPTLCNWNRFQTAEDKIWTVPITMAIWLGQLTTDWMLEMGGIDYFDDLATKRSNLLYHYIDDSDGFYNTFVKEDKYRSRMQVVFTIGNGEGKNIELINKFLHITTNELGWIDVKSHPLGILSDAIRITMYNPQKIEVIERIRDFMYKFKEEHT